MICTPTHTHTHMRIGLVPPKGVDDVRETRIINTECTCSALRKEISIYIQTHTGCIGKTIDKEGGGTDT